METLIEWGRGTSFLHPLWAQFCIALFWIPLKAVRAVHLPLSIERILLVILVFGIISILAVPGAILKVDLMLSEALGLIDIQRALPPAPRLRDLRRLLAIDVLDAA